jgi:hypothetical protein
MAGAFLEIGLSLQSLSQLAMLFIYLFPWHSPLGILQDGRSVLGDRVVSADPEPVCGDIYLFICSFI